ncbi:GNAT family N-acetyltransferase [Mangrovicella endophytica]|uniref:GNAT family N-acetyltransferase n=1 Tax=Mangrovicella endophytica TaxID=2066697 RepID=UPI001FE0E18E|nr:GNAT family N-acetyltransferase [Mangrovicella endophytica]
MHGDEVAAVTALADRVHPGLPEDQAVFAERLALWPRGCLVLASADDVILGYAVSHPIRRHEPPSLGKLLRSLPDNADSYYLHDVVVAPEARGKGHAEAGVRRLLDEAQAFPIAALISVYGTAPFWHRFGFELTDGVLPAERLAAYGEDARYMLRPNPSAIPG